MREFPDIKRKNGGKIQNDLEPNKGAEETQNQQTKPKPKTKTKHLKPPNPSRNNRSRKLTEFGFLVFRTNNRNEALWAKFLKKYNEILDEGIKNAPAESGLSRVAECVFMKIVDDESLANESPERVAFRYWLC